jgi:hypothetical protein
LDKEDCTQVLLSALQQPRWKLSNSVADWDLNNVLWKAGLLLTSEQVAALFSDIRRRGLISASERRSENHIVALWGIEITQVGEEWLAQHSRAPSRPQPNHASREGSFGPESSAADEPEAQDQSAEAPDLYDDVGSTIV